MKVALISPIWLRVPPALYGGIELIVGLLADGLVDRGHDVTLFATADARTKAKVWSVFSEPQTESIGRLNPGIFHAGAAYQEIRESNFDIVHDHTFSAPALGAGAGTPVLATIHGELDDLTKNFYRRFKDAVYYNAISAHQRRSLPELRYVNTVHNTIDYGSIKMQPQKQEYLLSLSRIGPEKAPHIAIEVAKRLGRRLLLAGKVDSGKDEKYFKAMIEPRIDGEQIVFLGEVDANHKRRLMAEASCFIFPIQWSEPFGLVLLEAMAAGTPVVAFDRGAASEVVKAGVSGFVARDLDDMIKLVSQADQVDPAGCRAYVEQAFPVAKMIDGYLENYFHILRSEGRIDRPLTVG